MLIVDGSRERVFDAHRFCTSLDLATMVSGLGQCRVYMTPARRNYGGYNASTILDGVAYTCFFTLTKEKGRLDKMRHSVTLRVESAYRTAQPSDGSTVSFAAAVDAVLRDKTIRYR